MYLLVSAKDLDGALAARDGGADIVDIETSQWGDSTGSMPSTIREIRSKLPATTQVSVSINEPKANYGCIALAALGCIASGADMIKIPVCGSIPLSKREQIRRISQDVMEAAPNATVAIKCWVDDCPFSLNRYIEFVGLSTEPGIRVVMLDTLFKHDGKSILRYLSFEQIGELAKMSHDLGKLFAISGSIDLHDIEPLIRSGADLIGLTRAVCQGDRRDDYRVDPNKVRQVRELIVRCGTGSSHLVAPHGHGLVD